MSNPNDPVHRLVIYRPKAGHHDQLKAILLSHGPVLAKSGLLPEGRPVQLYVANDLRRQGEAEPYFVEDFYWRDGKASDLAHQLPEIMAVWETMGPHLESMTLTTLESLV
ncbi:MAG TPA: hypothetical protein VIV11_18585 [Kofleriaceae bacterium]